MLLTRTPFIVRSLLAHSLKNLYRKAPFSSVLHSTTPHTSRCVSSFGSNNIDTCPLYELASFPAFSLAPTPCTLPLYHGQRLVVLGDVHGDYQALVNLLTLAGVCDDHGHWIGGESRLVQCGDIMDRGAQELACWALLCRLSQQASAAGGSVSILWGNHEVFCATGLFHYTVGDDDEYEYMLGRPLDFVTHAYKPALAWRRQFAGNQPARWAAMEPGGLLSQTLLQHLHVAVVVGRTLCVHAGLTVKHLEQYGSLDQLNLAASEWIANPQHGDNTNTIHSVNTDDIIPRANGRARAAARTLPASLGGQGSDEASPVWMRDYSTSTTLSQAAKVKLDAVLAYTGTTRMAMGHTPQAALNAAYDGKAWRVDVGASRGVAQGTPEVLEIVHGADQDQITVISSKEGRVPAEKRMVS